MEFPPVKALESGITRIFDVVKTTSSQLKYNNDPCRRGSATHNQVQLFCILASCNCFVKVDRWVVVELKIVDSWLYDPQVLVLRIELIAFIDSTTLKTGD